jgi:hypothetical protein
MRSPASPGLAPGDRPFRPMVDFLNDGAEVINQVAERMHAALLDRLGIADLLQPPSAT